MPGASPSFNRPYPLLLRPIVLEKVWGGRWLESLGKSLPSSSGKYGESWELADMPSTSASGAGGGAFRSLISNGPLAGKSLHDALELWSDALLPGFATRAAASRDFPLLIKFLDAAENLSVQVHPSPAFARAHADANLKTECWYIINAKPGAVIYKGIKPHVSRAEFQRLALANDPAMVHALIDIPAIPGECHNLPSGTVHALGAGVLVAEVQTPSDTTFRCFDWGRTGRALHISETLACASFPGEPAYADLQPSLTLRSLNPADLCANLVATEFFHVDELRPKPGDQLTIARACPMQIEAHSCIVLVTIRGSATLSSRSREFDDLNLRAGDTTVVPASISPSTWLTAGDSLSLLRVRLPLAR